MGTEKPLTMTEFANLQPGELLRISDDPEDLRVVVGRIPQRPNIVWIAWNGGASAYPEDIENACCYFRLNPGGSGG